MGGGRKRRQRGPRQLSPTVRLDRRTLWTLNAVPGNDVYGESLRRFSGHEHRRWDPNRSKLGAGMLRTRGAPERLLPTPGDTVLYLGAGHGTSVSHLYDHLCGEANRLKGRLVCVDLAPRCLRDLTFMAAQRPGLVPVLGDARQLASWGVLLPTQVSWLFQDVAQAGQVDIFLAACKRFLAPGGMGLLSLKAASERWTGEGETALFNDVAHTLETAGYALDEVIELTGYEDNHRLFVVYNQEA
ncbi:MAG: fibrillarin-like rRNA/tRNA 2'-O-methyltransferase [Candidatus Poseidonia sp.]|nr:fibrillarin-like rRNA/tRNA 2'-O-methyltransferase [Poseidonia sp.]